jgi:predicted DNA-binding transcriptional regulator AlpA
MIDQRNFSRRRPNRATLRTAYQRKRPHETDRVADTLSDMSAQGGDSRGLHLQFTLPIDSQAALSAVRQMVERDGRSRSPDELDRIIKIKEITQCVNRHRCTIYRWMKAGVFPKKHAVNGHKIGWLRSDLVKFLQARSALNSADPDSSEP